MADTTRGAVAEALHGLGGLTALLATYGGRAAVLAVDRIPPHVGRPFVIVDQPLADAPEDTKTTRRRDRRLTVRVYADALDGATDGLLDDIGERIRAGLHRQPVAADGETAWMAECSGPVDAPSDDSLSGRLVTVRLRATVT